MKPSIYKKQRGFATIIYVAIALLLVFAAALITMSRDSTPNISEYVNKSNVTVLISQATSLKNGFSLLLNTGVTPSTVTFDNTSSTGLFDPKAKYTVRHVPPANILTSGTPVFTFSKLVKLPGIGDPDSADYVATVGNVTLAACQMINNNLYKDPLNTTPATSTGALADWTTVPAAIDDSASTATNYLNRPSGCVAASGGSSYVFYSALYEN